MEITENLTGYEEMLVITLLLGRYNSAVGNWGVIEDNGNRFAATLDYGEATNWGAFDCVQRLLSSLGYHCYERMVTEKFLKACEKIIEKFEENYDQIEKELLKGIEAAEAVYPWYGWRFIPTVNDVMRIFTTNKRVLKHLCHQIRAELAIANNDAPSFQTALEKLDPAYKFPVLSSQKRTTFDLRHSFKFKDLIEQGYTRVFLCDGILPKNSAERTNRVKDTVYLEKTDKGIWMFLGQNQYGHEKLTNDQCSKDSKISTISRPRGKRFYRDNQSESRQPNSLNLSFA